MPTQLLWLRSDLRIHDNPALVSALAAGPTVACFVICVEQWRQHDVGDARIAFLLRTLQALQDDLEELGVPLKLLEATRFSQLPARLAELAGRLDAAGVHFNVEYPLNERKRDSKVIREFQSRGLEVSLFDGSVVLPPGSVLTGSDEPYTVFTPFKKRWLAELGDALTESPRPGRRKAQQTLKLRSDPVPDQLDGVTVDYLADLWPGGERTALARLTSFCKAAVQDYAADRDLPARPGTSTLSPYLSIGSLSPRRCFAAVGVRTAADYASLDEGPATWLSELVWREFYRHVVAQFPHVSQHQPFKRDMKPVRWRRHKKEFAAWCSGHTGYPLVDAAQRQLLATGWMHNRLRMVSAMFLSKHLLIDWRWGEAHFMRHLVDGDFAANNGGWQWSASTGTDAAPYFRIFNPVTQAQRFDGAGAFIHEYVPELRGLTGKALLEPWRIAGHDYVEPIVDHRFARERALAAFK